MNTRHDEKLIETAVEWWVKKVTEKAHHDNGDNSKDSSLAMLLADLGAEPVSDAKAEIFRNVLVELIIDSLDRMGMVSLDVDYNPCTILVEAAEKAEISEFNFPYKTSMIITETEVNVYDGYAAPKQTIYTVKENNNERK